MTEEMQIALIAGSSAVVGGAIATIPSLIQLCVAQRSARKDRLRAKLEELTEAHGSIREWWWKALRAMNLEEMVKLQFPEGATRCNVIAVMYFHKLIPFVDAHGESLEQLHHYLLDAHQHSDPRTSTADDITTSDRFKQLESKATDTADRLVQEIHALAADLA